MSPERRRAVRTAFQTALGLVAAMPLIVDASGLDETVPGVGVVLAVSAGLSRVMAVPAVDRLLPAWLRMEPPRE